MRAALVELLQLWKYWFYALFFNTMASWLTHVMVTLGVAREANPTSSYLWVSFPGNLLINAVIIIAFVGLMNWHVKRHPRLKPLLWLPTAILFIDWLWDFYQALIIIIILSSLG
ncbi:MAG: hypothetical protein ACTSV6_07790 [Candidatus Heimdallarchaeota archaeon]